MDTKLSPSDKELNDKNFISDDEKGNCVENAQKQVKIQMDDEKCLIPEKQVYNEEMKNEIKECQDIRKLSSSGESDFSEEIELDEARSRSRSKENNLNKNEDNQAYTNSKNEKNITSKDSYLNQKKDCQFHFNFPNLSLPLMNYSQFLNFQKEIQKDEALSLKYYDEYKKAHEMMQNKIFFKENKNSFWFLEKYDLKIKEKNYEEFKLQSNCLAKRFFYTLNTDGFHDINFTLYENETTLLEKENKGEINITISPLFGFDVDHMSLLLKDIPLCISKFDILNILKSTPGFISMS